MGGLLTGMAGSTHKIVVSTVTQTTWLGEVEGILKGVAARAADAGQPVRLVYVDNAAAMQPKLKVAFGPSCLVKQDAFHVM